MYKKNESQGYIIIKRNYLEDISPHLYVSIKEIKSPMFQTNKSDALGAIIRS